MSTSRRKGRVGHIVEYYLAVKKSRFQGSEVHGQSEKLDVAEQTCAPLWRESTGGEHKDS